MCCNIWFGFAFVLAVACFVGGGFGISSAKELQQGALVQTPLSPSIQPRSITNSTNTDQSSEEAQHPAVQNRRRHRRLKFSGCAEACSSKDISISQSKDDSSGIPHFIVQIVNTCISGCSPSSIHLHCGWFASAKIVNPNIFKRLRFDDCLVNNGKPLQPSQILRFTYQNSFQYPLSFRSARFC